MLKPAPLPNEIARPYRNGFKYFDKITGECTRMYYGETPRNQAYKQAIANDCALAIMRNLGVDKKQLKKLNRLWGIEPEKVSNVVPMPVQTFVDMPKRYRRTSFQVWADRETKRFIEMNTI